MTRIIAGFAGSLALRVPKTGTRPTSDRTREGIFSALESRGATEDARVLDLFAGSGALGLEAASRGAATVVLVERSIDAAGICRANARKVAAAAPTGAAPEIAVVPKAVLPFLEQSSGSFDLVFIDPPYDLDESEIERVLHLLVPRLAPDADVVIERSSRSPAPVWPEGLAARRQREYGETIVYYAVADDL